MRPRPAGGRGLGLNAVNGRAVKDSSMFSQTHDFTCLLPTKDARRKKTDSLLLSNQGVLTEVLKGH